MSTYTQLINNLDHLGLSKMKEVLPNYLDKGVTDNMSITDILKQLTDKEVEFREERARQINLTISHFPFHKTTDDFDFSYQPSINKAEILDLLTLRFIENNENIHRNGSVFEALLDLFRSFQHLDDEIQKSCSGRPY